MRTCLNIRKKLSAYQDRELCPVANAAVETHLRTCEACRKEYEALLQTYRMLRSLSEFEPAPGLSLQILDNARRTPISVWKNVMAGASRLLPAPAAMTTLVMLGFLTGALLGNFLTHQPLITPPPFSTASMERGLTQESVRVFDAIPPGSFAGDYLKLTSYSQEKNHE